MLNQAVNVGVSKKSKRVELPLKMFAREERSDAPFTGYTKKGNWYYKTRGKGEAVNVNAKSLNAMFETLLANFEYKKEYKARLGILITEGLKTMFAESIQENNNIKKNLSIIRSQLEKIEERYALGKIPLHIFERLSRKYSVEIEEAEQLLAENSVDSSNPEKVVEKGLEIIGNLPQSWVSDDFAVKRRLQELVS